MVVANREDPDHSSLSAPALFCLGLWQATGVQTFRKIYGSDFSSDFSYTDQLLQKNPQQFPK